MRDRSWLVPTETRVRHVQFRDSVGRCLSRDECSVVVLFDGHDCPSVVHIDDLVPEREDVKVS